MIAKPVSGIKCTFQNLRMAPGVLSNAKKCSSDILLFKNIKNLFCYSRYRSIIECEIEYLLRRAHSPCGLRIKLLK
jgi:hypothetical protein